MLTSSTSSGGISPIRPTKVYFTKNTEREVPVQSSPVRQYDSVTLSSANGEKQFREVLARLSQEARTATTTGDIQALRRQVQSGEYHPDPMAIAARMLFLGEEG